MLHLTPGTTKKVFPLYMSDRNSTTSLKSGIVILLFLLNIAGLLFSRALLSISMGLWLIPFVAWALFRQPSLPKSLLHWSWLAVAITLLGCWQDPLANGNMHYLSTMLAYPVTGIMAMASIQHATTTDPLLVRKLCLVLVCCAVASLFYPLGWYVTHLQEAHTLYGTGRTLPVFMDNDHVRYALFLNAALLVALAYRKLKGVPILIGILVGAIVLLAVRTGWVCLLIIGGMHLLLRIRHISFRKLLLGIMVLIVAVVLVWYLVPTVQQKVRYMVYDWQQQRTETFNPTLSDGTRRAMNQAAMKAIAAGNTNEGWAAVPHHMRATLQAQYPGQEIPFGWPFNQWMLWWMGAGMAGMVCFSIWLLYPIWVGIREKRYELISWSLVITATCIAEATLGYQYGVWLHCWPLVLLWVLPQQKPSDYFNKR